MLLITSMMVARFGKPSLRQISCPSPIKTMNVGTECMLNFLAISLPTLSFKLIRITNAFPWSSCSSPSTVGFAARQIAQ